MHQKSLNILRNPFQNLIQLHPQRAKQKEIQNDLYQIAQDKQKLNQPKSRFTNISILRYKYCRLCSFLQSKRNSIAYKKNSNIEAYLYAKIFEFYPFLSIPTFYFTNIF
ncbi:unnamed protein product [Paramecium sonneborni]|uniref:Uncharacterized protein n=1 Tax=Paramecium sonneborni TaxID=65129 RepID=A0A8S1K9N9_9CILI|nr:unnamed protein product [Paramecium sonneborni]